MSLYRIPYPQITSDLFDVRKLQSLLEPPLLVDNIVRSGMFVGSVQDGLSQAVDVVIGDSLGIRQFPRHFDRHGNLI